MKAFLALAFLALAATSFAADDDKDFKPLFNGKDTTGWHLRRADRHNSWTIEDGVLKNTVNTGELRTDLVGDHKFWNFTVRYDYVVPDGSISGFHLAGRHEIQIL